MESAADETETYQMRCGETYFTTKGRFIFHCTICEKIFDGFEMFQLHIKEHITDEQNEDIEADLYEFIEDDATANETDDDPEVSVQNCSESSYKMELDESNFAENPNKDMEKENDLFTYVEDDRSNDNFEVHEEERNDINTSKELFENVLFDESITIEPDQNQIESSTENIVLENSTKTSKSNTSTTNLQTPTDEQNVLVAVRNVRQRVLNRKLRTSEEERKHKCPVCNTGFKDRHNMIHHLIRHTNKKDHKCTECDKAFFTKSELKIHLRGHKDERPCLCNECGKTFRSDYELRTHIKRHKNQRDYKCEICKKAFFTNETLAGHFRIHTAERPFSCDICSATFPRRNALTYHLKSHENKRQYECEFCDSRFNQKSNLITHIKKIHD